MKTLDRSVVGLAVGMSALAGLVDALGFLELRGMFVSFMSGNSTRLAVNLAGGDLAGAQMVGGILLLFVAGMFGATVVGHFVPRRHHIGLILALVAVLLAAAFGSHLAGWHWLTIACMTLAMGAENAALQRDGEVVVGLTYMTGTLVKVGQKLAQAVTGGPRFDWLPYLMLWLGLVSGGIVGALIYDKAGLNGLSIAAVTAAGLGFYAVWMRIALPSKGPESL